MAGFRDELDLSALIESTVEANPGSASAGKAALLQRLGINRISLGILAQAGAYFDLLSDL